MTPPAARNPLPTGPVHGAPLPAATSPPETATQHRTQGLAAPTPTRSPLRIVLKLGGNVLLDAAQVAAAAKEIQELSSAGHLVALVHGGGPQLDAAIAELGEPVQKVDGLRVTSLPAADVVRTVMDAIGASLAEKLAASGVAARHIPSAWECFPSQPKDPRLGRVGTVECFVPPEPWPAGIAVLTPVGSDAVGSLNVNADEGACAVAIGLQADWLVLGTDVAAVRSAAGEPVESLSPAMARELVATKAATGGMVPKLANAVAALEGGVRNVLVTRIEPGFAQALLAGAPAGTLVAASLTAVV